jgi:D-lactate dehydrogenase
MKIAFFSAQDVEIPFFEAKKGEHQLSYFKDHLDHNSIHLIQGHEAICVFVNDKLDAHNVQILKQKGVRFILLRCTGCNQVNLDACHQAKIAVANVPQYSPHAVAEHALGLLLCLNRKYHKSYLRVREGNFELKGLLGFDLYQKTIGIIGLGSIGRVFAQICHGLGMRVLAYDPITFQKNYIQAVNLNTLFKESDVISLHCPLNPATKHIINDASITLMKQGVFIINTGRGGLIESKALIRGLKSNQIGAVGLDVYEQEGAVFFEDHSTDIIQDDILMRLTTFPNVLITSHQGFLTKEALLTIAQTTFDNLAALSEQKHCPHIL